jgi:hypothetical protein
MSKAVEPKPNDVIARIGVAFARLFKRMYAVEKENKFLRATCELLSFQIDELQKRVDVLEPAKAEHDELMTQLEAAADEDTDDE